VVFTLAVPAFSQNALRVDSNLVLVPAQVTNEIGTPIIDLKQEQFRLFENGVEQQIRYFAREDSPVSVGVLLDASGSMRDKKAKAAEAAARFFRAANPEDEFFLIEFSDRPHLSVPFTTDSSAVYARIFHARPFGQTSLYDAVHMALKQMKQARNERKAILILSDGGDNRSRYSFQNIRSEALESDVQIYAMGIVDRQLAKARREEREGPELLTALSEPTGGRHYPVFSLDDLPEISARIGEQLRSHYLLGYSPAIERDGKYRKVRVEVVPGPALPKKVHIAYRRGYYTPVY